MKKIFFTIITAAFLYGGFYFWQQSKINPKVFTAVKTEINETSQANTEDTTQVNITTHVTSKVDSYELKTRTGELKKKTAELVSAFRSLGSKINTDADFSKEQISKSFNYLNKKNLKAQKRLTELAVEQKEVVLLLKKQTKNLVPFQKVSESIKIYRSFKGKTFITNKSDLGTLTNDGYFYLKNNKTKKYIFI